MTDDLISRAAAVKAAEAITGWMGRPHMSNIDYGPTTSAKIVAALRALPAAQAQEPTTGTPITMTYRNYRGEVDRRTIIPSRIWWGATDWHPEPGWLLSGYDLEKAAHRDFALADCQFADLTTTTQEQESDFPDRIHITGNAPGGSWSVAPHKHFPSVEYVRADRIEALEAENDENCRLLGMSAERELALRSQLAAEQKNSDRLAVVVRRYYARMEDGIRTTPIHEEAAHALAAHKKLKEGK